MPDDTRIPRAVALIAALALVAAPAEARRSEPLPISPSGLLVQQSALAAGGDRAVALMAGYRPAERPRRWTLVAKLDGHPAQRLDGSVFAPVVAAGPDGTAVAVWAAGRTLRAAIAPPGRTFGTVQTLASASGGVAPGGAGVAADGSAVVAWRHGGIAAGQVRVATRRRGGRFRAGTTLGQTQYPPAVAVAPSGQSVVTWLSRPRMPEPGQPATLEGNPRVMAVALDPAATPVELAGPPQFLTQPPAAAAGPGGVVVAWREEAVRRIARLDGSGAFSPLAPLPAPEFSDEHGDPVAIALPSGAPAVAVWPATRTRSPEDPTIVSAQVRAGVEPFTTSHTLSSRGWKTGVSGAAAVGHRTVVAWSEHDGRRARVRARARGKAQWGRTHTLAAADAVGALHVVAGTHFAAVGWVARSGTGPGRFYVARQR